MSSEVSPLVVRDSREQRDVPIIQREVTPMDLLRVATAQGADLDRLEKLMELEKRWRTDVARRAYHEAMAAFHADPPQIVKNKHVNFATKSGDRMDYWHATHDEVCSKVGAALAKHGLSHSWRTRQEQGTIYVTCTITHKLGHAESFEMYAPPDTSGLKSAGQAIASTTTFLQRYTLLGGAGLSSAEQRAADTDGKTPEAEAPPEGFDRWWADMEAVAEEGLPRLTEAWGASKASLRRWVVKFAEDDWKQLKDRAREVKA